jgi:hypothetical protein
MSETAGRITPPCPLAGQRTSWDNLGDRICDMMDRLDSDAVAAPKANAFANLAGKRINYERTNLKYGRTTAGSVPAARAERVRALEAELAALKGAAGAA